MKLKDQAEDIRLKLVGLHERDIRKILGKPDAQELLSSSQEIYIYYLSGSPKCTQVAADSSVTEALTVRMDALGNVREATMLRD
ncbi:hypothetical protein ACFSC6_21100 [Rufibacter sediminis]|uniref:Lipoprotein SmpA/OmlA domain-containing protein n=1 Tax=Rufibacter sediminis TaxID=2762756 RepID=A0ABR6VRG7_9BACT|nr:hypothetical protein [Rufibacter sediminis]MBC3539793.1 hypothetical protein [Rufibacter sediminis]